MEQDRGIMTVAAGGIGLVVTLVTTVGSRTTLQTVSYAVALVAFLVTVIGVIGVFARNASFIEAHLRSGAVTDAWLERLDRMIMWSFMVGLVASTIAGFVALASLK